MPTKSRADYINQSISYFLHQQYPNKELIVIYDQASDLPDNIIQDQAISYHQVTDNFSIGAKRSQGCSLAQGEIIAQWDDDDWYSTQRLSVQAEPIINKQADLTALRGHCFYNLWDNSFWQTSPALYNKMFREGVAGGTLMFLKKYWSAGCVDYNDEYLREDADFMSLILSNGGRLQAIDGKEHFIYLRHLKNSWSFVSGKLLQPSEWCQTLPPKSFENNAFFYQELRQKNYASYCNNDESICSSLKVTCLLKVVNEAQLIHALTVLSEQDYLYFEAVIVRYYRSSAVQEIKHQSDHSFAIKYLDVVDELDYQQLSRLISGDIVMNWPEKFSWVSAQWITYQVDFIIKHDLDLTGLAQPMYFFPEHNEFWQYIYPENTEIHWMHPETLCFKRSYWEQYFINEVDGDLFATGQMPHQHIEHFLCVEQDKNKKPNKEKEPRWFPYDITSMKDLFVDMNFNALFSRLKKISNIVLIGVIFNQFYLAPVIAVQSKQVNADESLATISLSDETIFHPDFFEQYQPQSALDMIYRIPGFSFNEEDNARGFGGNAGNVLVDFKRPMSKSEKLSTLLSKIPATQVERIEVYQGARIPLEVSGQIKVVNVIRKNNQSSGSLLMELRHAPDDSILPKIEAVISTNLGQWQTGFDIDIGGQPGYRKANIEYKNNELLRQYDDETFDDAKRWLFINGKGVLDYETGSLTLSGQLGGERYKAKTTRDSFAIIANRQQNEDEHWRLLTNNTLLTAEFGIDWTQNFNNWQWQNIALAVVSDQQNENDSLNSQVINNSSSHALWQQDKLKTEFIIRSAIEQSQEGGFTPKFGIEIAENTLSSDVDQKINSSLLTRENIDISELRAEIFADFSYQFNPQLSVDGGLTAEFSRIAVTGDLQNKKSLYYLKPRLSSNYLMTPTSDLTITANHSVGQLDFSDFARSSQPEDGRNTAGNIKLVPEQTTELTAIYNWKFIERGNLKVTLFHQWREDVLEQILLPNNEQGLGNAGQARFWGINTEISVPIDALLKHGLFEISYEYKDSSFDNPNGRTTNLSNYIPNWLWMSLRQDISEYKSSWGIEFWGNYTDKEYLADETIIDQGNDRLKLFFETSQLWNLKIRLQITHFNTGKFIRTRQLYRDNISTQLIETQIAYQEKKPEFMLSIWNTF